MKLLTIRVEKSSLQLAEVQHSGKKIRICKMRLFPLPENLENGGFIKEPKSFCDFIFSSMERGKLNGQKATLLLDVSSVVIKEYTHEKTKGSHLLSLAGLEAEAILPEGEGDFIIENEWYGSRVDKEGLQKSAIYAVSGNFIAEVAKEFKEEGIKLEAVYPTTVVHTDIIKKLLSKRISGNEFDNKTIAALDLSHQEIRVAIFQNRELIHQRTEDLSMEEFYRSVSTAYEIPAEEAEEYCLKNGFDEESQGNKSNPEAYEYMVQTGVSLVTRLARSIRIILNSEGISLDQVIFSGTGAAMPGFLRFVTECLGVHTSNIDEYYDKLSELVDLDDELKGRTNLYQRLIVLAGVDNKEKREMNFLTRGIERKRSNQRTIIACTLIFIATLMVMSILPINYYITSHDYKNNKAAISSKEYVSIKNLLEEQRQVQSQLQAIEAEADSLPFGESNVGKLLAELDADLFAGTTINSLHYDDETEAFYVVFSTADLDSFVVSKNKVNERGTFKVSLPLTINSADGLWQCQISIKVMPAEKK